MDLALLPFGPAAQKRETEEEELPVRNASAIWERALIPGKGKVRLGNGRQEKGDGK